MEQQIEEVLTTIQAACKGYGTGTDAATVAFVREFTAEYADTLGMPQIDVLMAVEKARDYSAPNYYQRGKFPRLDGVSIYATKADFLAQIPSRKFRCPCCAGESTDPERCNSGLEMEPGKVCNWASFGLFKTLGKGLRVLIKESFLSEPVVYEIFMPLELEQAKEEAQ